MRSTNSDPIKKNKQQISKTDFEINTHVLIVYVYKQHNPHPPFNHPIIIIVLGVSLYLSPKINNQTVNRMHVL